MEEEYHPASSKRPTLLRGLCYGGMFSFGFFVAAFLIGVSQRSVVATLSLIGTSIALEAQPAAAASIPLRFHPFFGALVSILANLIVIPIMMFAFNEIVHRWTWARGRLRKAEKWSTKYGRYGVWILTPLSPVLGAYVCITVGYIMRWNVVLVLSSVLIGMISSSFIIAYGGHVIVSVFR